MKYYQDINLGFSIIFFKDFQSFNHEFLRIFLWTFLNKFRSYYGGIEEYRGFLDFLITYLKGDLKKIIGHFSRIIGAIIVMCS